MIGRLILIAIFCAISSVVGRAATAMDQGDASQSAAQTQSAATTASNTSAAPETSTSLEEVVVTAQKRNERSLDVPIPVTAISADTLFEQNQTRFQDYFSDFPGLNFGSGNRGELFPTIRGIGTGPYNKSTVGTVIDDVPYGASAVQMSAPDLDPSDLDHIEVLRGPQGTLYGASSIGGLIKYVTVDPSTDGFSGRLEAGTSTVHNGAEPGEDFRGAVNAPVTDTLAIRASGFYRQDPGYVDDPVTGADGVNEDHAYGGHLAALWSPSETFSLKLTGLAQHSTLDGSDFAFDGVPGFGDLQQHYVPGTQGDRKDDDVFAATAKAKFGEVLLTSITGYSDFSHFAKEDLTSVFSTFVMPFGVSGAGYSETNSLHKISQELRLSSTVGKYLDWLVGGFYTHESFNQQFSFPAVNAATGALAGVFGGGAVDEAYEEFAAFADVTAHLTDQFDVQVGLRQSSDKQPSERYFYYGDYASEFYGSDPTRQATSPVSEHPFTYLFTPQFKFSQDVMVYARLASGFRPGGGNEIFAAGNDPATYGPDKTVSYEVGVKASVWDHILSVDASVYRINWNNVQFSVTDPRSFNNYTANVGEAKSQGLELSTELRPVQGTTISAWIDETDAALTKPAPATSGLYAMAGNDLPYSSRFSGHLSLDQLFPIANLTTGFVGAMLNYVGQRQGNFEGTPTRAIFPAYAEIDLRAGVKYDSWTLNLTADNVADKRGEIGGGLDGGLPPYPLLYIRPRTIGLTVSKTF